MIRYLPIVLFSLIVSGCAFASTNDSSAIVQRNIGKLLLSHDQKFSYRNDDNPFGVAIIFGEFEKVFDSEIKKLPIEDRIDFLWAAMWHLSFDGHSMMQFQKIVANDCGDEFVARLESYVKKESELSRNKTRLYLSKKVLFGIRQIIELGK